ncbi:Predicted dehydrogenase [Haloechinothrix alba]|uniref:Predicted dehydrogenase n=1 Tax=Haloechinothrix alba TaxID=664784 RepID=A0A238W888_9PSEU|nr:Gfo/Idh/MocA family oxidoreductase [Haloechinothrix alba]SNR42611.1 Predicted dehydrogenase [Haloechinothrix alba]
MAVRVGLIGAGPWASAVHAPGLARHPGTSLAAVWSRRPDAASALATGTGARVCDSVDELLARCDAVAFAVPPDVQAELAVRAARAGRHLILEKPLAADVDAAGRLADAAAGVTTVLVLTLRYWSRTRSWLDSLAAHDGWAGASLRWLSGALLSGHSSPWRHEGGALADIGPHALDLLDAGIGEITSVLAARHTTPDLWNLLLGHACGATSTATLSLSLPMRPTVLECAAYGRHGYRTVSGKPEDPAAAYAALLDEFVEHVRAGKPEHPCDVRRGLHLQRILAAAGQRAHR